MSINKIILKRDKSIIYIKIPGNEDKLRYDLNKKRMEKLSKGNWYTCHQAYKLFENYSISDIECEEPHFTALIMKSKALNPLCYSVSTFIARLDKALIYENYEQEGIATECSVSTDRRWGSNRVLSRPLNYYRKDAITFFKKHHITVTYALESITESNYDLVHQCFVYLDKFEDVQIQLFINRVICSSYNLKKVVTLIKEFKYDLKSLINYLLEYLELFENVEASEALEILLDYYRMAQTIGRDMKKYPKYLKSMHDIITANYNSYKREYDEAKFKKLMKKELEFEDKVYCIVVPENSKELIFEGTSNNNCVASYVDKILNEQTYLFFLRKTESKGTPLITLELQNNRIVQAKGAYNRLMTEEERKFMVKYCNQLNLELTV